MAAIIKKKELYDTLVKAEVVKTVLTLIKKDQPVTMDGIAKECGIAKGTLYNYFENKKDMMDYVHKSVTEPVIETNNKIFESTGDPLKRLHEFVDAVFSVRESVAIYFFFVQSKRTVADEIKEKFDFIIRPLIKFCAQGIKSGTFIDVDPYVLAEMIYGTVIGPLKSLRHTGYKDSDKNRIKQDILRLVDRIILK